MRDFKKIVFFLYAYEFFFAFFIHLSLKAFFLKPLHFKAVVRLFVVEFVRDFQRLIFFLTLTLIAHLSPVVR